MLPTGAIVPVQTLSILFPPSPSRPGQCDPHPYTLKGLPMKKLKLNVEELTVTSFETHASDELRGTVRANEATDLCSVSCTDPFSTLYKIARTLSFAC